MSHITTVNPATEEVIAKYPLMSNAEVDRVILKMDHAQQHWAETPLSVRKQCFQKMADLLLSETAQFASIITEEMGKPITQSTAEIKKCAKLCEYYVAECEKLLAPQMIKTEFQKSYRAFQPLGIIFAIMPWNYPFWQVMRFAVPNLMAGNAGILKHAPNCMGTALAIENLFLKAGFPEELFRAVVIDVDLAPFVIQHPLVAGVTLTGSNRAGKSVASAAGAVLKKLVLELGGSDPYLILEDADLELAAEQCAISRLSNAGQVCIAAKRIIVVKKILKDFSGLLTQKARKWIPGDPRDPSTQLGPMARADLRKTVHDQVKRCIAAGAECVLGGQLPKGAGYYYPATVLTNITSESPAFSEEIFGPVVCIISAEDEEDAIRLANQTEFGLAGAVFTRDLARGEKIARDRIMAGFCSVNAMVASDPRLPFGGTRQSGYGRELSVEGMREFMDIKTVVVA